MNEVYALADIIVSRAGAGTLSELAIVGKPVILIPSPNVSEDHQTKNAMALVKKKAAVHLPEKNIEQLAGTVKQLLKEPAQQKTLAENIKKFARPGAVQHIVDEILKNIRKS
jgi:UDP-N-acetylglucosamine--N-acetylmuramyl-(pentapeptide) pyrophosphoryl-undecaprenol N-acetylglucosamine transferase